MRDEQRDDGGSQLDAGPGIDPADAGSSGDASEGDATVGCELPERPSGQGVVATERGWVRGVPDGSSWTWKGIPFAAPPVGALRWRPPAPPACWAELDADRFGPRCPQTSIANGAVSVIGDEDCLTLNVWSPVAAADGTARPVMVYIHGGANIAGSAREEVAPDQPLYRGRDLAVRGDVVVVTIQYRLGMLGFGSLPALDAEAETGTSGNYAAQDQIAALEWVQRNVEAFGGDPGQVTVFGESAGAMATCALVASPLARGLFHRAISQSGGCPGLPKAEVQSVTGQAAAMVDCAADDLACLRAVPAQTLVRSTSGSIGVGESPTENGLQWAAMVDGHLLPDTSAGLIEAGLHNDVPFMLGSNADEMASPQLNRVQIESVAQYERTIQHSFPEGSASEQILAMYPAEAFESPNDAFVQVLTDMLFSKMARDNARRLAGQVSPVYRYFFRRRPELPRRDGRAAHGIELLYVFGTLNDIPGFRPSAGDLAVSDHMMDAWIAFARSGHPSTDALGEWPAYARASEQTLVFDESPRVESDVRGAQCDLWDTLLDGDTHP